MIGMIRLTPEERVRWYFPSRSMIIVCACWTMRIPRATIEIANSAIAAGTISAPMLSIAHISLSTYSVAPSTRTTITRVPGSSAASMSDAARQSSPSTNTRPFPVTGSMRSETIPTLPASASTLVRMADPLGCRCRSKKGRMPTRDKRVPAAKLSAGTIAPGTTRETTPAARQPTATESSQKPGASISATNRSRAATSQTCHSCMGEKLARKEEAGNASSVIRHPSSVRFGADSVPEKGCLPWTASVVPSVRPTRSAWAMQDFRRLRVWAAAHQLTLAAYRITRRFPRDELYGLTAQIRRSAASICANIAEGCGRRSRREFARFLDIAQGSASELEYHWILACDLGLLDQTNYESITAAVTDVKKMLTGLVRRIEHAARTAR